MKEMIRIERGMFVIDIPADTPLERVEKIIKFMDDATALFMVKKKRKKRTK